jgi:hypothetical protein
MYVYNIQICKILQNTDFMYQQWPNSIFLPDIIYKMHEGEIDSPHKDPLYHIFTSQVFFYLLVLTICLWGEQVDRKHFDLGKCSIHNADIYIVYSPFGESENREIFFLLKIWFIFFSFLYRYFILYTVNYTNSSKYLQIFWTQNKSYLLNSYIEKIFIT